MRHDEKVAQNCLPKCALLPTLEGGEEKKGGKSIPHLKFMTSGGGGGEKGAKK